MYQKGILLQGMIIIIKRCQAHKTSDLSFGPLSDLIHDITENGLRHASGPVHAKHPFRYMHASRYLAGVTQPTLF